MQVHMGFFKCVGYLAIVGMLSFILGRMLPKKWFRNDLFPYKSFYFEKEGRIYERLYIRYWHTRVFDMSKVFPKFMPPKNLVGEYKKRLLRMIQETCVAEFIHFLLGICGLYCLKIWPGKGGMLIGCINIVANTVFIIIQRYNRPRLLKLYKNICRKMEKGGTSPK